MKVRYSDIEWYWKLLAWAIFLGIMAAVYVFLNWLIYDALPEAVATHIGAAVIGFAIGSSVTQYLARRGHL